VVKYEGPAWAGRSHRDTTEEAMRAAAIRAARAIASVLLPVAGLAACSDPAGPDAEADPDPTPTIEYDLVVETRYINVRGSCDEDFLGNSMPGHFQYRIVVSGVGQSHTQSSRGYNEVTGENFQRNATTDINFTNRTYQWRDLSTSARIEVELGGVEWDLLERDSRMANRRGSVTVPFELGTHTRSITIGATAACQIRLYYDATWSERSSS
jgi:hypothetical protein